MEFFYFFHDLAMSQSWTARFLAWFLPALIVVGAEANLFQIRLVDQFAATAFAVVFSAILARVCKP